MLLLKNCFILDKGALKKASIIISGETIKDIIFGEVNGDFETIDVGGLTVFPGFIDPHVHFDDPGFTDREDFETGSKSAIAGGYTTVIDMPCTSIPPVINKENFDYKLNIVQKKAFCDFAFWGGVTPPQLKSGEYVNSIKELEKRGVVGFKFYTISGMKDYPRMEVEELDMAFRVVKETNLVCAVHSEDFHLVNFYSKFLEDSKRKDPLAWCEGRAYEAEPMAIWEVVGITRNVGNKLHIVHLTTKAGLEIIKWGKLKGIDITAETCPHYLSFTVEDLLRIGPVLKTAPPVRNEEDRCALWEGLRDGSIDFVATDHAAGKYPEEKSHKSIWDNYAGIPGIQLAFSVICTYGFHENRITLQNIQDILSENASMRFGLMRKGKIEKGYDADFSIVDLNKSFEVSPLDLYSKGRYTPFEGRILKGKVIKTILRGKVVYEEERGFTGKPTGRYISH